MHGSEGICSCAQGSGGGRASQICSKSSARSKSGSSGPVVRQATGESAYLAKKTRDINNPVEPGAHVSSGRGLLIIQSTS